MAFSNLLKTLRRGWWIIILTTAIAIAAAFAYTKMTEQVLYISSTRMVISPNTALSEESDLMRSLDTLSRGMIIPTFAEIYKSHRVMDTAFEKTGVAVGNALYKVNSFTLPETNILVLTVTGPDAKTSQILAGEVSQVALDVITEIYPMYTITTLEEPNFPGRPIGSDTQRYLVLALFLGAGLGVAITILIYGDLKEILGMAR